MRKPPGRGWTTRATTRNAVTCGLASAREADGPFKCVTSMPSSSTVRSPEAGDSPVSTEGRAPPKNVQMRISSTSTVVKSGA